ncbi:hypothetical protein FHL15_002992 [Xylaria flabelliformis]|uniref:Uncharacterized protein n=1 Tax=Xylaria flabelliformis TaxID=2512241 RepID=A0A553I7U7_9PEZI|nr:hypothetical protein FHL15_002992 [Xylaria flabelliformis]
MAIQSRTRQQARDRDAVVADAAQYQLAGASLHSTPHKQYGRYAKISDVSLDPRVWDAYAPYSRTPIVYTYHVLSSSFYAVKLSSQLMTGEASAYGCVCLSSSETIVDATTVRSRRDAVGGEFWHDRHAGTVQQPEIAENAPEACTARVENGLGVNHFLSFPHGTLKVMGQPLSKYWHIASVLFRLSTKEAVVFLTVQYAVTTIRRRTLNSAKRIPKILAPSRSRDFHLLVILPIITLQVTWDSTHMDQAKLGDDEARRGNDTSRHIHLVS